MNIAIDQNITTAKVSTKKHLHRYDNLKTCIIWGNRAVKSAFISIALYEGSKDGVMSGIAYAGGAWGISSIFDDYIITPMLDKIDKIDKKKQLTHLLNFESESWNKLQKMPGLDNIKQNVELIRKHLIINLIHESKGKKPDGFCYHMQLLGNSGTGKTEVAKLLASILHDLGVAKMNKVILADRSSLASRYINDSALKAEKVVNKALGGVLVIDEAYALSSGDYKQDGGHEVIEKLLVMMEQHKNNLSVIFLGYEDKMNALMKENRGLKSRIRYTFKIADYNQKELIAIFKYHCLKLQYTISDEALQVVEEKLIQIKEFEKDCFGNGRSVVEFLNKIILTQNSRLIDEVYDINNGDIESTILFEITALDVENTSTSYIGNKEENQEYKNMYS